MKPQGSGCPLDRVGSALDLVRSLVEETDLHSLSEPQRGILKFGLEQVSVLLPSTDTLAQVLASLLVLLLDCRPPKDARVTANTLATVTSCLHLLQTVAGVQEWTAMSAQVTNTSRVHYYLTDRPPAGHAAGQGGHLLPLPAARPRAQSLVRPHSGAPHPGLAPAGEQVEEGAGGAGERGGHPGPAGSHPQEGG